MILAEKQFQEWWEATKSQAEFIEAKVPEGMAKDMWYRAYNLGMWGHPPNSYRVSAIEYYPDRSMKRIEFADGECLLHHDEIIALPYWAESLGEE